MTSKVTYCFSCTRDLTAEAKLIEAYNITNKKKISETDYYYQITGETIKYPIKDIIDDLHLSQCCVMYIISKNDIVPLMYGVEAVYPK